MNSDEEKPRLSRREWRRLRKINALEERLKAAEPELLPERPPEVSTDSIVRVLRVAPECEGMRLDRFLTTQLRATSRTRAQIIIRLSAFTWEGRRMRSSERMKGEQRIVLWRPALNEEPPPHDIEVIYEDDALLVINKPPLMTVHPTARHHRFTVIKQLEAARPGQYLSLIHRLDRETSGVLMLSKSPLADRRFKIKLEERSKRSAFLSLQSSALEKPEKTYIAITWGIPQEGVIDLPIETQSNPLKVKMGVAKSGEGLPSRTGITILAQTQDYALVRCELYTGRQHQIRVHLAAIGTPIVGDKLYGPDEMLLARGADGELTEDDLRVLELNRHALHAHIYRIAHCFSGDEISLKAPLPADLCEFWLQKSGSVVPKEVLEVN